MDIIILILLVILAVIMTLVLLKLYKPANELQQEKLKKEIFDELRANRNELNGTVTSSIATFGASEEQISNMQNVRLKELSEQLAASQATLLVTVSAELKRIDESFKAFSLQSDTKLANIRETIDRRLLGLEENNVSRLDGMRSTLESSFKGFSVQSEQKLDNIRNTVENRLKSLQDDNALKLEKMRETVDEKLQKTLDDKLKQSFSLVSERLEQVYSGLGEMKTLANGVGDLKKVLSNVKTRGILGEIQLGAILQEMLSPEQYVENIATKKGSSERVEFAIKLPGDGERPVYLPIDAKFPADTYTNLLDAYETGDASNVAAATAALEKRIKGCAKDIHDKYIYVPDTTDFAIMFLPTEGLYAEVIRCGLIEKLQADYKVNIAGPTTMAALLNSLQMGFKTLAIQKRSSEVWDVLGGVKSEFDTFAKALAATQNRIKQAGDELETLVGTRTRQMQRKLKDVHTFQMDTKEDDIAELV